MDLLSCPVPVTGIQLATAQVGFKQKDRDDLLVIAFSPKTTIASVYTHSQFRAPCIQILEERCNNSIQALVVNSGNANAATGEEGYRRAELACSIIAKHLSIPENSVLPFSTGVIGEHLPTHLFEAALPQFSFQSNEQAWLKAADAIRTTDTFSKVFSVTFPGKDWVITGIAKGSGMIHPNMATMLAYVGTNALIPKEILDDWCGRLVSESFNRITVDGDESTNDAFVVMATGKSEYSLNEDEYETFYQGLNQVAVALAKAIVSDGEGATKFVTIEVEGASEEAQAKAVCFSIANSPLVKTMLYAQDPNLGRLCMAIGKVKDERILQSSVDIWLNDICVLKQGVQDKAYREADAQRVMELDDYCIRVNLNIGEAQHHVWTCDYSYDYIRINAEYRS